MNVALFGGTFDPVHFGHLIAANAARKAFGLDAIHFVPATLPPHKRMRPLTPFVHRYAMLSLACAGTLGFIPSLLESAEETGGELNYSLPLVRRMLARLSSSDRLYFLIGSDAFLDIGTWHEPVALLDSCNFIVVSRPGFPIAELERVIPPELRRIANGAAQTAVGAPPSVTLRKTSVYLLNTVTADVSSSHIRRLASEGKPVTGMVPDIVAEYIQKSGLYRNER